MSEQLIRSVLVVGGGTAGWLTAANLARTFGSQQPGAIQVTLVESPDVPIIGVGEGTWPTMRRTLQKLGINEAEFLINCQATFKQGTCFINWQQDQTPNHYHHLFTSLYDPTDFNLAPYWLSGLAGTVPYAEAVSAQAVIARAGLAPKKITSKPYEGILNYSYHLDAGKFSVFLQQHATAKLGVHHISAHVSQVKLSPDGAIAAVVTADGRELQADFFVDCSGFQSMLLGEALGIGFTPVSDILLTDHAVTIQVPYPAADAPINACTHSTAQQAGWIWDIGLTNRRGVGHVYSSQHQSHDAAEQTLRDYIGPAAEGLTARRLSMRVGYRNKFWHKNCVAIGLSAAFVEPLEASAIFLVEAAANMLADQLPTFKTALPQAEQKFNQSFGFRWKKTIDFIKMHYVLSKRQGEFWQDNRQNSVIPDSLQQQLLFWQQQPVSAYDFAHVYEPFPMESYQYVLYGMGFAQQLPDQHRFGQQAQARECFMRVQQATALLRQQLPAQRELLEKIHQYGFQQI
jgi:flavin-dependent dehydrogenase